MKDLIYGIIISFIVFGLFGLVGIVSYKQDKQIHTVEKDTVYVYVNVPDSSLIEINDSLYHIINILDAELQTTNEELIVANFKLERIKEYNRIAANGNNITFLRGWINRVLND